MEFQLCCCKRNKRNKKKSSLISTRCQRKKQTLAYQSFISLWFEPNEPNYGCENLFWQRQQQLFCHFNLSAWTGAAAMQDNTRQHRIKYLSRWKCKPVVFLFFFKWKCWTFDGFGCSDLGMCCVSLRYVMMSWISLGVGQKTFDSSMFLVL